MGAHADALVSTRVGRLPDEGFTQRGSHRYLVERLADGKAWDASVREKLMWTHRSRKWGERQSFARHVHAIRHDNLPTRHLLKRFVALVQGISKAPIQGVIKDLVQDVSRDRVS